MVPPDGNYIFKDNGLLVKYTLSIHRCSIGSLTDMPAWEVVQPRKSLPTLALRPRPMQLLRNGRKIMTQPASDGGRHQRRVERSRKGGLALKAKYGRDHFVWMGRRGGRPTWQEGLAKAKAREFEGKAKVGRPSSSEPTTKKWKPIKKFT